MSMLLVVRVDEGPPEEDGQDHREHDDLLERTRIERAEALDQAHADGTTERHREAGQPAEHRRDEALEADQEAGVVVDGGGRRDQQAGQRADEG
eukprot:CAMPEP_0114629414 /NCGR_PEP_ID=MMETSP0168-20121206/13345_1 /TAXON_ID=95228 ORGANISM="Vannella sp., Strain DIVA3 517/6/12" /NCGR_SAMPLE_ID=MMETSP0168 /ASSEMBLY_ACC=CAM_ASM_000044 /LENGTH=93 /DNA_ID=CAMNT_0001840869 /DNA_START=1 /DNA_END=278 /DNA_ORIENTATION=-